MTAFAVRMLQRDWRGGELGVLLAALVVAVGSVSSVGFFTDRIRIVMERQAGELLGADLLVASPERPGDELLTLAGDLGLSTARTLGFRSVVVANDLSQLAEVKAVGPGYPLRGRLRVSDQPYGVEAEADGGPPAGGVWLEARLAHGLGVAVGDRVAVGYSDLPVTAILVYEPDRGGEMFNIAPRLMMALDDVQATGLVQPGSRVEHKLLVAGGGDDVAAFRRQAEPLLQPGERLQGVRDARPELRTALERAQRFLGLAALVSVVLAGVAIAISARRYAARHLDGVAVMRCFGATQKQISQLFAAEMLLLGLVGGVLGCVLGFAAQELLARALAGLVGGSLPAPTLRPLPPALATGLIALLGFGLPPVLGLRRVPPLRVLRRDLGSVDSLPLLWYGAALAATGVLMLWYAGDPRLGLWVLAGVAATLLLLALAAAVLVRCLAGLKGRVGVAWRFGLANIHRRGAGSVVQVVALGLGIMVLLVLTLVRSDLLNQWQATIPPDAPNYFLINVQPGEVAALEAFLAERGLRGAGVYPMVRARLQAVNGRPVVPENYANPRARRLAAREFNLSWAPRLQQGNRVVAGQWWDSPPPHGPQISMEEGIAGRLGLKLGDRLRYRVAGEEFEVTLTSLREVQWDTFRPNFFAVVPPGVLEGYPATWITSFHLQSGGSQVLADLVQAFPGVTVLDVDALMSKVREIIQRVILAVEYVFGFTLLAGLIVLYAAVQATRDERIFEGAVLRTLGARRSVVVGSVLAEFGVLGLVAGGLAAVAATLLGYGLGERLFGLDYTPDPLLWLSGLLAGVVGVTSAGWLATRGVLDQPPVRALRE